MGNNCHEFVEYYFGLAKAGFVAVPVNSRFSAEEAAYLVNHSESTAFIYTGEMEATAEKMLKNTPGSEARGLDREAHRESVRAYEDILSGASDAEPPRR